MGCSHAGSYQAGRHLWGVGVHEEGLRATRGCRPTPGVSGTVERMEWDMSHTPHNPAPVTRLP